MAIQTNTQSEDDPTKAIPTKSRSLRAASVQKRIQTEIKLVSIFSSFSVKMTFRDFCFNVISLLFRSSLDPKWKAQEPPE